MPTLTGSLPKNRKPKAATKKDVRNHLVVLMNAVLDGWYKSNDTTHANPAPRLELFTRLFVIRQQSSSYLLNFEQLFIIRKAEGKTTRWHLIKCVQEIRKSSKSQRKKQWREDKNLVMSLKGHKIFSIQINLSLKKIHVRKWMEWPEQWCDDVGTMAITLEIISASRISQPQSLRLIDQAHFFC